MLVTGVEPVRVLPHGILSPGRLPIPPHQRHQRKLLYHIQNRLSTPFRKKIHSLSIEIFALLRYTDIADSNVLYTRAIEQNVPAANAVDHEGRRLRRFLFFRG